MFASGLKFPGGEKGRQLWLHSHFLHHYSKIMQVTLQTPRCSGCAHYLPSLVNDVTVCVVSDNGMVLLVCESSTGRMGPKGTSDVWTLHDLFLPSAKEQAETAN